PAGSGECQSQGPNGAGIAQFPLHRDSTGPGCPGRGHGDQHRRRPAGRRARVDVATPVMRSTADRPQTQPQLRECPGCGLFQTVPALMPGMTAQCERCPTTLRRTSSHRLDHIIALTAAAFVLLVVMCTTNLMSVETSGIKRTADLFSGPEELVRQNMAALGA